ncbi:hemolysin family protein [Nocardioides limicola]|uniref:hemolysin family protein n=1 Tax=Nocardioides limicola TaxID=2803368 RepID=UPI00193B3705|nr:hemolysin family protein [Nocardioides sp. DJM-14]
MSNLTAIGVAVALLAANAFFVGAEFALIAARRSQIEPRALAGSRVAKMTLKGMENVSQMMAGAQLGITICSLGLGAVGEPAVAHTMEPLFAAVGVPDALVHPISFVIAMAVVVCLHVVLGEMVPKNIAIAGPERAALVLGPPMLAVVTVFRPLIVSLNAIANVTLRMIRIEPRDEVTSTFTREEVAALVEESRGEGLIELAEYHRLSGALDFTERTVDGVALTPASLVTINRATTASDVEELCAATGYSRFPVAEASGELTGYLHIKDALVRDDLARDRPIEPDWVHPFATVAAGTSLHDALEILQREGAHMGCVVDEAGTLVGITTLEDVLEELVGEIRDAAHLDDA